jgi:hypothetical protein
MATQQRQRPFIADQTLFPQVISGVRFPLALLARTATLGAPWARGISALTPQGYLPLGYGESGSLYWG